MQNVSKNIFWLSISRAFALVLLFFAYTRLFRYLGPQTYGQYQFILSYVMIFSTVVDFGIQQFVTKKIAENPEEKKKYFQAFLAFEFVLALVLYAGMLLIARLQGFTGEVFVGIAVCGLGMVANALCYPFLAVMSAMQDLRKVALLNFLNSLVNISFIFLAIFLGKGIVFLSGIQLTFGLLDILLYRKFVSRYIEKPNFFSALGRLRFGLIGDIVRNAWPFVLLVGFSAIYNRIDSVLVSRILGFEANGYYGAAYKIFDLVAFFPAVVSHSLYPHFTSLMALRDMLGVRKNLERYLRLMLAAALPMAVLVTLLAEPIILLTAGEKFLPAAPLLKIIIWAPAALFVYIPVNSLVISQLTKKAAAVTGFNVVLNVAGNLLLLPVLGAKAAAIMTVVSEFIQGIFYFVFVHRNISRFHFWRLAARPAAGALVMGGVIWLLSANPYVAGAAGVVAYVVVLALSGFFLEEDIAFLKKIFILRSVG